MKTYFITSTGTEIGKTYVMEVLCHQARANDIALKALKPVVSGYDPDEAENSDPGRIVTALGSDPSIENINAICPWRFRAPIAPDMAAKREGVNLDLSEITKFCQKSLEGSFDLGLIEGAGGVMAPITQMALNLDWMKVLDIPVILVAGTYLGTISHTLSAIRVMAHENIKLHGIVLSASKKSPVSPVETADAISRFAPDLVIKTLPRQPLESAISAQSLVDWLMD